MARVVIIEDLYQLLKLVEKRPQMYLDDEPTLSKLHIFTNAYLMGKHDAGNSDLFDEHFHGFHDWIAHKYGFSGSTPGWSNMIHAVILGYVPRDINWESYLERDKSEDNHEKSLELFFNLLREYRGI